MEKVKQIEALLRGEGLSEKQLRERLEVFNTLDYAVSRLITKIPEFKGIEVYGSILNEKFNGNSDIDTNFLWDGYDNPSPPNKDTRYIKGLSYYRHIMKMLERKTKHNIHQMYNLNGRKVRELLSYRYPWSELIIPFGVFLGNECYREEAAKKILHELRESGRSEGWHKARKKFNEWRHKDLTNPEDNYKLSSFTKLARDYQI